MIELRIKPRQMEVLDQASQCAFECLETICLFRLALGSLPRRDRSRRSVMDVRPIEDVRMLVTRTVVTRQRQARASKRQADNPARKVLTVPDALALVNLESKVFILFTAGFERALAMNGLTSRLLQPMCSWIDDPFAHFTEFFDLFVGVEFGCHYCTPILPRPQDMNHKAV